MINNKYTIGVTGGSGSGKSTLLTVAAQLNMLAIDCDKVVHANMHRGTACYGEIIAAFGQTILSDSGEINRRALGDIVFADKDKLRLLSDITHKAVHAHIYAAAAETTARCIVIDAPVLFQSPIAADCDVTIAVVADRQLRISRIAARDDITPERIEARLSNQLSDEELAAMCDIVLRNDGSLEEFAALCRLTLENLLIKF